MRPPLRALPVAILFSVRVLAELENQAFEPSTFVRRNRPLNPLPPVKERRASLEKDAAVWWAAAELLPRHGDEEHHHSEIEDIGSEHSIQGQNHAHAPGHVHKISHEPWATINETDILLSHHPNPPSYFDLDSGDEGHRGMLITHIVLESLAFFVLLPTALFLKAGSSKLAILPQTAFLFFSVLGLLFGMIYKMLTPNLYPDNSHVLMGWIVMLLGLTLNIYEACTFTLKLRRWVCGDAKDCFDPLTGNGSTNLRGDEESFPLVPSSLGLEDSAIEDSAEINWSEIHPRVAQAEAGRTSSTISDETLFDSAAQDTLSGSSASHVWSAWKLVQVILERALVVLGYVQVISGIVVYSGSCRAEYGNGCLAHSIKGSIFFWYGLLTFARYVGAYAEFGWAWNRRPKADSTAWSAEFTESFVIFVYGSTNTWLERLGASDSSYSIKDVQHISIAVMFWFAGGLGMLLESRRVRSWLSLSSILASGQPSSEVAEPAAAAFSFNPFPALCIGVTGIAMAAHAQAYQFQVDIHALWGQLLAAFSLFRLLTYFFLFLRPPASILPSRPPTEALASFCLAAGGVVFILSIEEVTFAAMRSDFDDVMAFLNITVAFICIVFTWILLLFALKGWALSRAQSAESHHHHQHHRSASVVARDRSKGRHATSSA